MIKASEWVKVFWELKHWRFSETGFSGHTHSFLLRSVIVLDRGLLCFPVNVIIFTKQAALPWCAKDFFLMALIDLYPPEGSELTQLSQVLTSHPHTIAQWNCSTGGYSLRSRQRSGCSWRDQDPGVQVLGHLDWRSLFGPFPPPSFLHFPSPVLVTRGWSCQDTGASLWNPWDLLGSLLSLHLSLTDSQLLWFIYYWTEHLVLAGGGLGRNVF